MTFPVKFYRNQKISRKICHSVQLVPWAINKLSYTDIGQRLIAFLQVVFTNTAQAIRVAAATNNKTSV